MANDKKFYYVGVQTEDGMRLVTSEEGKTAYWNKDEKPMCYPTKRWAQETAFGLVCNMYPAVVIESIFEIKRQMFALKEVEATEK